MYQTLLEIAGEDRDVVWIYQHKRNLIITKEITHMPLESLWGVTESFWRLSGFKQPFAGDERGFL